MPAKIAAGNWKMNGTRAALGALDDMRQGLPENAPQVLICPPATLLSAACDKAAGSPIGIGAQDCHAAAKGAHTGDISAPMIADAGATHVILGHSERRTDHGESNKQINAKVQAAWAAGLTAILCIGETLAQREAGQTLSVLASQIAGSLPEGASPDNTILAYEPVWAIGTGLTASPDQIAEVHADIQTRIPEGISILYGGSVKGANAAEIFAVPHVHGALVGGASLTADDFLPIVTALAAA